MRNNQRQGVLIKLAINDEAIKRVQYCCKVARAAAKGAVP